MNSSRKFFDVAHPGLTAPSATSRPVLSRPLTPDPMFSSKPAAASAAQPAPDAQPATPPVKPETTDTAQPVLDPTALLIQAGQFEPPKASVDKARRAALIAMMIIVVVLCGVTYWLVSTM